MKTTLDVIKRYCALLNSFLSILNAFTTLPSIHRLKIGNQLNQYFLSAYVLLELGISFT